MLSSLGDQIKMKWNCLGKEARLKVSLMHSFDPNVVRLLKILNNTTFINQNLLDSRLSTNISYKFY